MPAPDLRPRPLRSVTALVATSLAVLTIALRLGLFWIFWVSICPGSRTTFKILLKSVGESSQQLNYYGKVYSGLYEFEGHVVPYVRSFPAVLLYVRYMIMFSSGCTARSWGKIQSVSKRRFHGPNPQEEGASGKTIRGLTVFPFCIEGVHNWE